MNQEFSTVEEIEAAFPGHAFEANYIEGGTDVCVWETEEAADNDDGSNAVARFFVAN